MTVLITGGTRGVGRRLAEEYVRRGIPVAITGRDAARVDAACSELARLGGPVAGYTADATDTDGAAHVVDVVSTKLGPVGVLINNAGVAGPATSLAETPFAQWWRTIEVNVGGAVAYSQAVLPGMIARRTGVIINTGSYAGARPGLGHPAYAVSKTALARFSEALAAEVRPHGISVFTVSPGLVATDMTRDDPQFANLPENAWSDIDQIADLVVRLSGPAGTSPFTALTGRFIHVNDDLDRLAESVETIERENLFTLRMTTLDGLV